MYPGVGTFVLIRPAQTFYERINIAAWMQGTGAQSAGLTRIQLSDLPDSSHAFLVILAHIVVLGTAAFWLFQRRDIAGARGE